ncbi:MAG TPA: hypothetical protein VGM15_03225 [Burkholderiaceae bacterium]|jgi:hypothetical protein
MVAPSLVQTLPQSQVPLVDHAGRCMPTWFRFFTAIFPLNKVKQSVAAAGSILFWDGQQVLGDAPNISYTGTALTLPGGFIQKGAGASFDSKTLAQFPAPNQLPIIETNGSGITLPAADVVCGVLVRSGPGGSFTDTFPAAGLINNALPITSLVNATGVGTGLVLMGTVLCINASGQQWSIAPGASATFFGNVSGGNYVIASGAQRSLAFTTNVNLFTPHVNVYA